MKIIFLILFLLGSAIYSNGQQLTGVIIEDKSNKIEINFFNNTADTNGIGIIIRDTVQKLYYYTKQGIAKDFDISKSTQEINRIKELCTKDFIKEINKCCKLKNCPNSVQHGYSFFVRKDAMFETGALDINFIGCGDKQLSEIINILNKLFKNYR